MTFGKMFTLKLWLSFVGGELKKGLLLVLHGKKRGFSLMKKHKM